MKNYYNPYGSQQTGYNNTYGAGNNVSYGSGYNATGGNQVQAGYYGAQNNSNEYGYNQQQAQVGVSNYGTPAYQAPAVGNYGSGYNATGGNQVQAGYYGAQSNSNAYGYNQQQAVDYSQQQQNNNMNYYNRSNPSYRY